MIKSLIFLVGVLIIAGCSTNKKVEQPNILFITTDCQAWEDVQGITNVLEMPALERLRTEGVVFENHYSVAPLSMPSRYSIISGRYPHYHKMMDNGGNWLPDNTPILMEKLVEAGYQTGGIGKMDFKPWERKAGFDFRIVADCQGESSSDTLKQDDYYFYLKKVGLTRWDYLKFLNSTDIQGLYDWPLNDTLDIDYFVGAETIKTLKSNKLSNSSPWFLWVSFNGPHYPWDATSKIYNKYINAKLPAARYRSNELDNKPFDATFARYNYSKSIANTMDQFPEKQKEIIHQIRAGHYGNLTWIDQQMGKIIDALKTRKDFKNTIIVFTSVNGALLGDHQLIQAGVAYERASHVPFVVWWPGHFKSKKIEGFSSHTDIFPTLMNFAGSNPHELLDGNSLVPVINGEEGADSKAFIEVNDNYTVVTNNYKLGLYTPYNEGELYDHDVDPNELFNVYNDNKYKPVVDSLTQMLFEFYPNLQQILSDRIEYPIPVTSVTLKQGDNLHNNEVPFLQGTSLKIMADIKLNKNATGPIVIYNFDDTHGFALYAEKGLLQFGVRKWDREVSYKLAEAMPNRRFKINLEIDKDGLMKVVSPELSKAYQIETNWPLPKQQGHQECLSKTICAGVSGDGWMKPFGHLNRALDLEGIVYSCLVSTSN